MVSYEGFRTSVVRHYQYPPSTWSVTKASEGVWAITAPDGSGLCRYDRKRDADHALESGSSAAHRIWSENAEWYEGTSNDPRVRALDEQEREIVAEARAAHPA